MSTFAVVKTGGKQYLVQPGQSITVDRVEGEKGAIIELAVLASFDAEKNSLELGSPELKTKAKGKIIEHGKGDKVRAAKFKSKARFRKVTGYRPAHSTIEITSIA